MPSGSVARLLPRVLVLWDVDHTLIETRGVGFAIYQRAFKAATGKDIEQLANVSGRTELDIVAETLRVNRLEPTDAAIAGVADALTDGYEAARSELATKGRALPGAKETLALLAEEPAIYQSLLTGNLKEVARIKVETFGLAQYLNLEAGAYGEDNHNRAKLVHLAQQRTQALTGTTFTNNQTVLIGDTPNDVRAAKAAGVHIIGAASGKSSGDELRRAGAENVLADLRDAEYVRRLIGSLG
jgi:phosphoglycolate phosphatase